MTGLASGGRKVADRGLWLPQLLAATNDQCPAVPLPIPAFLLTRPRPISQTLALGERDFDNQTAARMAGLNMSASSSQPRRIDDELGRAADAAVYARLRVDADDDDVFDTDEQYAAASVFASMRHDTGNGLPMASKKAREQEGFDNDMLGEDEPGDSNFAEGDDEYDGAGHGSMESGPSMGGEFDEQMHD